MYRLSRKKFIKYVAEHNPELLFNKSEAVYDLWASGEHIIDAQGILDQFVEIPSNLVEGGDRIKNEYVEPVECELMLVPEKNGK